MATVSDTALLKEMVERQSTEAFTELFRRFQIPAFNLALHLTNRRELAEEAVQEAMLAVWSRAATFRPELDVRKWLLGIVAKCALKAGRQDRRSTRIVEQERQRQALRTDAPAPSSHAEERELVGLLQGLIAALPEAERRLVALYYGAGLSQEEIGEALELPQRTVSFKLKEALERLRRAFATAGMAVALPALTEDSIGNAIVSGHALPHGLLERTLLRCSQPVPASGRSVRAAGAGRHAVLGLVCAAALLGGAYAYLAARGSQPAPAAPAAAVPDAPAVPAQTGAARPVEPRTWTWAFEQLREEGLEYLQGEMSWKRPAMANAPCLVMADSKMPNVILLPPLGHRFPILITVTYYFINPKSRNMLIGFGWSDGTQSFGSRRWLGPAFDFEPSKPIKLNYYCNGRYSYGGPGGEMLTQISEYLDYEHMDLSRIYITGCNIAILKIEVRELRAEEIPPSCRDMDAVVRARKDKPVDGPGSVWGAGRTRPLVQFLEEHPATPAR